MSAVLLRLDYANYPYLEVLSHKPSTVRLHPSLLINGSTPHPYFPLDRPTLCELYPSSLLQFSSLRYFLLPPLFPSPLPFPFLRLLAPSTTSLPSPPFPVPPPTTQGPPSQGMHPRDTLHTHRAVSNKSRWKIKYPRGQKAPSPRPCLAPLEGSLEGGVGVVQENALNIVLRGGWGKGGVEGWGEESGVGRRGGFVYGAGQREGNVGGRCEGVCEGGSRGRWGVVGRRGNDMWWYAGASGFLHEVLREGG